MLGAGVGRPAAEIGVVGSQKLSSGVGGGGDDYVDDAEAEAEDRAVGFGKGV